MSGLEVASSWHIASLSSNLVGATRRHSAIPKLERPCISSAIALIGALVYGAADFLGGLAAQAPSVDRRDRGGRLHPDCCCSCVALPRDRRRVDPVRRLWGALSGVVRRDRDRAAVRVPRDRADEHPVAAHRGGLGDRADAVGARRRGRDARPRSAMPVSGSRSSPSCSWASSPASRSCARALRGILMAIGAGVAIGAFLIIIDQTSDESGLVPLVMSRSRQHPDHRSASIGVLALAAVRAGRPAASVWTRRRPEDRRHAHAATPISSTRASAPSRRRPARSRSRMAAGRVACGVLDAAANRSPAARGAAPRRPVVVSALTALYPAGTIILAAIVLRERIAPCSGSDSRSR